MVSFSPSAIDLSGATILPTAGGASDDLRSRTRRVSRTATLDGGAAFVDRGYSDSDRTIVLSQPQATKAQYDAIMYLIANYALVGISTTEGFFSGAISEAHLNNGTLQATVLIKEKLSQ